MTIPLILVVAMAENGVIGRDNRLLWRIKTDMGRFRRLTMGKPMIMGRKTFESLPGLLPDRRHIVITRDEEWSADGAETALSVQEALALADEPHVSVIGGAEIFELFLPLADKIELTEVHGDIEGDVFLPPFDASQWREVARERHEAEEGRPAYSFVTLERSRG
jgi:dihydrofolate reductase